MLKYYIITTTILTITAAIITIILVTSSSGVKRSDTHKSAVKNTSSIMYLYNQTANVLLQTTLLLMNNRPDQSAPDGNNDVNVYQSGKKPSSNETPCYGVYGCFPITAPWSTDNGPTAFYPEPPAKVNTKFCLRTRRNAECQFLDPLDETAIFKSQIDRELSPRTIFIIHGYLESLKRVWMQRMTSELLKHSDVNVVIVDWGGGSGPPYAQAVANIRLVGAMTARLIRLMIKEVGLHPKNIHVIGHSLGAHAASYVGYHLQEHRHKLGRITGLDAAEPRFTGADPVVRLDPSDAEFVDAIHTDAAPFIAGGLGIREPVGHVDFYPNGGRDQPGCADSMSNFITEKGSVLRGLEKFLNCNHVRSNDFFIESINSKCGFWGVQCHSWEEYKNGSCFSCGGHHQGSHHTRSSGLGPRCARMGMHAIGTVDRTHIRSGRPMKLYLMTGAETPLCRDQYRVTLHVSNSTRSVSHGGEVGILSIVIKGRDGVTNTLQLNSRERYFEPGSLHQHIVTGTNVGHMTAAILSWEYRTSVLNPLTWRLLVQPRIHVASVTVENLEARDSMTINPPDGMPVISRKPLECQRSTTSAPGECQVKLISSLL